MKKRRIGDPLATDGGLVSELTDWQRGCTNPAAVAARMAESHISGIVKGAFLGAIGAGAVWWFFFRKAG